jgi:mannosyltransferase
VPVVLLVVVGAFLRFFYIGHQGFWYDEAYTAFLVHFSPGKMIGLIPSQESTPPLYYCVAWVWARIFGYGPAGLRSLSAVCGVLTIPIAYFAALKLLQNRWGALLVAALTACSPLLIWYSQEARAYSMLVMFAAASLLAYAYARENPSRRWLSIWAICCALGLATHYYAALVIAPEAALLLYAHRRKRAVWGALAFVVVVAAALLPLLSEQSSNGNQTWIAATSVGRRLSQVPTLYVIGTGSPLRDLLKFIGFACVVVAFALLVWRGRREDQRRALLPLGIALCGFAIVLVLLAGGNDTLLGRNLLPLWLPFTVALGAGLGLERTLVAGIVVAGVLCVIGLIAVIGIYSDYWLQRPDWQPVAVAIEPSLATSNPVASASTPSNPRFLGTSLQHGSRLVIVQGNPGVFPLGLYLPGLTYDRAAVNHGVAEIDVVAVKDHPGLGTYCWWGSACNLVPSQLQSSYPVSGFHQTGTVHVKQFSIRVLAAGRRQTVTRAELLSVLHRRSFKHDAYLIQPASAQ